MILIIHQKGRRVIRILQNKEDIPVLHRNVNTEILRIAKRFPEELLCWVEETYLNRLNVSLLPLIFHHDLVMCSYPVENLFLPQSIGFIDRLPFVNPSYKISYPTWRMSSDLGGVKGKTLMVFKSLMEEELPFGYNLNSIAKVGQQNSLFCYSEPRLLSDTTSSEEKECLTSFRLLFRFVYQHYKWPWVIILFFCFMKYKGRFPIVEMVSSFFAEKKFNLEFDLDSRGARSNLSKEICESVDVIIPTLGRPGYLKQVLADLKNQALCPEKVIVVEQNPDKSSESELSGIQEIDWPFQVIHLFTHEIGACNARNLALKEVTAEFVFFADDDIRIAPEVLELGVGEMKRLGINCLNMNCKLPHQNTIFRKVKQWGSFGAGTSIVRARYALKASFSRVYENGYGEDQDYGMQLRGEGCDIVYHPDIEIIHLKAPIGGFRSKEIKSWEKSKIPPKPSPTLMIFAKRNYSEEQLQGFKVELFMRYYWRQRIRNPLKYLSVMKKRWKESEKWALVLEGSQKKPA